MIKITGTNTFIDVEIDGRIVRIHGEMGMGGFYCHKGSMQEWLVPAGEKISEEDKKMIIQRVMEKTAGSHRGHYSFFLGIWGDPAGRKVMKF